MYTSVITEQKDDKLIENPQGEVHRGGESSAKTKRVHGSEYALQTQRGGLGHQNIKGTNQGVRNKICKGHRASESSKITAVNNVLSDKVPQIVETV